MLKLTTSTHSDGDNCKTELTWDLQDTNVWN